MWWLAWWLVSWLAEWLREAFQFMVLGRLTVGDTTFRHLGRAHFDYRYRRLGLPLDDPRA